MEIRHVKPFRPFIIAKCFKLLPIALVSLNRQPGLFLQIVLFFICGHHFKIETFIGCKMELWLWGWCRNNLEMNPWEVVVGNSLQKPSPVECPVIPPAATSAIKMSHGPVTMEEHSHILFLTGEPQGFLLVQEETVPPQTFLRQGMWRVWQGLRSCWCFRTRVHPDTDGRKRLVSQKWGIGCLWF